MRHITTIAGRPVTDEPVTSIEVDQLERRLDAEVDQPEGDVLKGLGIIVVGALLALAGVWALAVVVLSLERVT